MRASRVLAAGVVAAAGVTLAIGALSISVYVSSDFGGGYIELGPDASVKRINYP